MRLRSTELGRTLATVVVALGALFSFLPFLGNLLLSLLLGGRFRRKVRRLLADRDPVPVDEASGVGDARKFYFLAGEESGDLHAANVIRALKARRPDAEVRGMGGSRMADAGCELDYDLVRMSVMGVLPVLRSVGTFFRLYRDLLRMLDTDPPDVLVTVDYPGFNLRVARAARRRGVRVISYIAPQVWAWAPWRTSRMSRIVDEMLVILPFERELFRDAGVSCRFVGHPLFEHLEEAVPVAERVRDRAVTRIGLLPGSRRSEVRDLLPFMLAAARRIAADGRKVRFVLPYRSARLRPTLEDALGASTEVDLIEGRTHETMRDLDFAMVASGTATLELAYYGVPMVVMYRVGRLASILKRICLIVPHVALVNIVAGQRIVPEMVGSRDPTSAAAEAILGWLDEPGAADRVRAELDRVRERLLFRGVSERGAGFVLSSPIGPAGSSS